MNAFHAYDIRGVYGKDFSISDCYKIGYFLVDLLKTDKVLVGHDARISSPEIFDALCDGITDAGADVYNVGLATTPMIYFGTAKYNFNASVQITASHNPKEYNGMKISGKDALPIGFDSGLKYIKEKIDSNTPIVKASTKGKIKNFDVKSEYLAFLKSYSNDFSDLKITVDCSNGMAGLIARDVLGNTPEFLYETVDGSFPNHEANPLDPKNVVDLQKAVIENNSDIGLIFDGDGDRVMFVDEKGQFISPDLIIALLGHYFLLERGEKGAVLQDIRSSKAVGEYLTPMGATIHTWRVGRAFAAPKLREINGIYGGELAGHYYFRDFFYSDSGMLACLVVLNIVEKLKRQGTPISKVISQISSYANSGEINFKITKKKEAIDAVVKHFTNLEKPTAIMDFDGYRVEFNDWWFNIRPSNTEPYLRFLAEAKSNDLLTEKVEKVRQIIQSIE